MPPFSRQEMLRRVQRVRSLMAGRGLDCLIATSYVNSYYLSGAPIHPFGRPMATVLPLEGEAAMVVSVIELEHVRAQSWIEAIETYYDYNIGPEYDDPQPPPVSFARLIEDILRQRALARGRIGIEDATLPLATYRLLRSSLPEAELVGVSDLLDQARMVLSTEELALVRAADAVADLGLERLVERVRPGVSADELSAEVRGVMVDALLAEHPDKPFHLHVGCGLGSPEKSAGHSEWTTWSRDDRVRPGQLLETVISVWLWGYWGNVERAVYVGEPSDEVRRAFAIMIEANEEAIAAVRPGVRLAEIDRIAKAVFSRYGFTTRSGSGCGRGIVSYEANARELAMDVRLYSDVVLQPGMAFSLEPDLHVPGIGTFRHCNTVIVTEDGCEVDSRLPRGMICV
jgi:Xaa-Pro dipeptidase